MSTGGKGVELLPGCGGLWVDGARLADSVVQRSGLLLELRKSCTGSATIPLEKNIFKMWCQYAYGSAPWADLVKILEVCPTYPKRVDRPYAAVCGRHLHGINFCTQPLQYRRHVHAADMQASSFLQDPGSSDAAARQCATHVRAALRAACTGSGADKITIIHKIRADCLTSDVEVRDSVSNRLLALPEHHLLAIMHHTNLHDVLLLHNVPRLRLAALNSRLRDGNLPLSGCLSGKLKSKPFRNALREYASSIHQQHLQHLDISNNNITPADKPVIEYILLSQPQLRHLNLSANEDLTPRTVIPALYALTCLLHLDLSGCYQHNDDYPRHILRYLGHFSHLQSLNLLQSPLSPSDHKECAAGQPFSTLHSLTLLSIGACPGFTLKLAAALTHHLPPCMQQLTLSWDSQAAGGPGTAAPLPDGLRRLTALTHLHFQGQVAGSPTTFSTWPWRNRTAILRAMFAVIAALPDLSVFLAPNLRAPADSLPALVAARGLGTLCVHDLASPSGLFRLTQLKELDMCAAKFSAKEHMFHELEMLTGLEALGLGGYDMTHDALGALRDGLAGAAPRLRRFRLALKYRAMSAEVRSAQWPGVLSQLTSLTWLSVNGWEAAATAPADVARAVAPLRFLRHLDVGFATDPDGPILGLGDGNDPVDGDGLGAARAACAALGRALQPMTNLTALQLSGDGARGADALIPELIALRALHTLRITHAELGEEAAEALSELLWGGGLPQLQVLDLSDNALTVVGMMALAEALPAAQTLQRLVLEQQCGNGYDRDRMSPDRDSESSLDMNPLMHPWRAAEDSVSDAMSVDGSLGVALEEVEGDPSWEAETEEGDPWWENEAAAEKLWGALARLPLDRGVEL